MLVKQIFLCKQRELYREEWRKKEMEMQLEWKTVTKTGGNPIRMRENESESEGKVGGRVNYSEESVEEKLGEWRVDLRVGRENRKWSIVALIWRHGTWALATFVNEPSVLVQEGGLNQPWVPLLLTSILSHSDRATNTHLHTLAHLQESSRMPLNLNALYQNKGVTDLSCFHMAL